MEVVRTVVTIIHVIVTVVSLDQTVKQLIIAITRTVLVTAHATTNTTHTNVYVLRDTQVLTVRILTVTIMDVNMVPPASMDILSTRVHVQQDIKEAYVKRGTFVIIRNAQEKGLVTIKKIVTHVFVLPGF